MPRRPGFEKPDIIIPRWVKEKGEKFVREYCRRSVLNRWHDIVGKVYAKNVRPRAIRGEEFLWYAASPAWAQDMKYREREIVSRINSFAGLAIVKTTRQVPAWFKPEAGDILAMQTERVMREREEKEADPYRQLAKSPVTHEDEVRAKELSHGIEDEDLKNKIFSLYLKSARLKRAEKKLGFLPCPKCGVLTAPKDGAPALCGACRRKKEAQTRREVRRLLLEVPWARPAEVKKYVPEATPGLVSAVRAALVQELAGAVMAGDSESLAAMQLVMLYRVIPPEELTEDQVTRALYELRFNLVRPADWHAPKRYSIIKRGREGKRARVTMAKGAHRLLKGRVQKYHGPDEKPKE